MQTWSVEGWLLSAHLVQYHSQRPDVALEVVGLGLHYLRGKVVGCADYSPGILDCILKNLCDSEVADLDDALLRQKDILALEVSVQDLAVVDVLEPQTNLGEPLQHLGLREHAPLLLLHSCLQVAA